MPRWDCWCGAKGVAGAFCPWCGRRNPGTPPPDVPPAFESAPERNPYELPPPAPMAGPESVETHDTEVPEGPRVGLTPVTRALGAALTALLVLGAVTVERRSPDPVPATVAAEPSPSPSPSETEDDDDFFDEEDEEDDEPSEPPPPPPSNLDAAVASAMKFVEVTRRRPFKKKVDVRLLAPADFREELLAGSDDEEEAPDGFADTMKGLRLAEPDEDPEEEEEELLGDSVVGFYDDDADRLVVRGGELDWYVHMVLVHELVHAWQDQHFDLDALQEDADTMDEALALRSLVEGDAQWVETLWLESQPDSVQEEIERLESDEIGTSPSTSLAQRTLALMFGFPYGAGEQFVDSIVDDSGIAGLDAAYARPPRTTTEVFDFGEYEDGFRAQNPPDPKAGGRVLDRGTIGHLGLLIYLFQNQDDASGFGVSTRWRGDEYVTWRSGRDLCTTVSMVMDDSTYRDELVRILEEIEVRSVAKTGDTGVTFTSCAGTASSS